MRSKYELEGKDFSDDMSDLEHELKTRNVKYTICQHEGASPKLLDIIGYYPTGQWHIRVGKISIIRGYVSFGDYECLGGKFKEVERFTTAKELVDAILDDNYKQQ